MKVICTRCGGTNIACEAIVNPNTGKIIDYLDESFMHANCGDCKEEVVITDVDRVKKDIDSMFFEFVKKNGKHAAECMCTDRMGSMMDIDIYILKEEDRPYECHYLKDLLEDRVARIAKMHEDESYTYNMDDNYWCATCGSHSHKKDSKTGYCWYCDTVNWVKEDGKDVGI